MEWIRIGDNKLKIMLSAQDARHYALNIDAADPTPHASGNSFRGILSDLLAETGFDAGEDKMYIQLYPSKDGGCELFITKIGLSLSDTNEESGARKERKNAAEQKRSIAFLAPCLDDLSALCRRLVFRRFTGESEIWRDENGAWWLFLTERGNPRTLNEDYRFAREFAVPKSAEYTRLLLPEHAQKVCARGAVEIFARF